ncbi:MAG: glycosyltransferase family 39 protein [bacterium]
MVIPKRTNYKYYLIILLMVLLIIGGFLRLWNLAERSLWVDEVNTVFAAQSVLEMGKPLHPSGVTYRVTPLFNNCVAFTYQILHVDEATSRIPAAFFGIFAVILVFYCAKEVFDKSVGLFSAFLMTFSHFEIGWSRVARPYTLLQVFTLLIVIFFIKAFENQKIRQNNFTNVIAKPTVFQRIRHTLGEMSISLFWILPFIAVLGYSFFEINDLTIFVAVGLLGYLLFMGLVGLYWNKKYKKIINKYSVLSLLVILGGVIYLFVSQNIQNDISFYLGYTPPWAVESSPVSNSFYLFNFLISSLRFPLAVFFFLGCIYLMSRRNCLGWILLWVFLTPLFLLSFVFTHRAPRYLFYVYPFFLMISSYGFINIVKNEITILKRDLVFKNKLIRYFIVAAFFTIFLISPWFRMGIKIPFLGDGITNGAVTTDEWKEASKIVKDKAKEEDVIITSLPQVAYFYGITSDYGLNWVNLNRAKINSFKDKDDQWIDIYVGIPCIESLNELQQHVESNDRGWIVVTKYHFEHPRIIPPEVREYLINNFKNPLKTQRGTVVVFYWYQEDN